MNILKHKDLVEKLLKKHPELKDDDNRLVANVWSKNLIHNKINPLEISADELLRILSKGLLPNTESIRRIRQKLQQEFPELRGKKYLKRHGLQDSVKEQLYETPEIKLGGKP